MIFEKRTFKSVKPSKGLKYLKKQQLSDIYFFNDKIVFEIFLYVSDHAYTPDINVDTVMSHSREFP